MARKQNDDLLIEDELAAAFLNDDSMADDQTSAPQPQVADDANWGEAEDDFPGQLAVDVYETDDQLVVKARTALAPTKKTSMSASATEFNHQRHAQQR